MLLPAERRLSLNLLGKGITKVLKSDAVLLHSIGHSLMVKLRRKLLVMVLVWLLCLKVTDIFRELYRVARFVAVCFVTETCFGARVVPTPAIQIFKTH